MIWTLLSPTPKLKYLMENADFVTLKLVWYVTARVSWTPGLACLLFTSFKIRYVKINSFRCMHNDGPLQTIQSVAWLQYLSNIKFSAFECRDQLLKRYKHADKYEQIKIENEPRNNFYISR